MIAQSETGRKGVGMQKFGQFYLDKEKDIIVELYSKDAQLSYILRTPYHKTGNLITNLASLCNLPISFDESGLKVIRGDLCGRCHCVRIQSVECSDIKAFCDLLCK